MDGKRIPCLQIVSLHVLCAHLTITVSEIQRDIYEKIVILSYPLHSTPPLGGLPSEYRHPVWYGKNWNCGATRWWKNFEDIYNGLGTIPACDRQTDRQTDGQTTCHQLESFHWFITARYICISAVFAVTRCSSVCLSRSWITSKRINISSQFFYLRVVTPF